MKRSTKITTIIIIFFIIIAAVIGGRYAMKIHFQKKFGKRPPPAVIVAIVKNENFYQKLETYGTALSNKTTSFRIKKTELLESINFDQKVKKGDIIAKLKTGNVIAPFSGMLGKRGISESTLGSGNSIILTLDDTSIIFSDLKIPEVYAGIIKKGLSIEAKFAAYKNKIYRGNIESIASRIDAQTRSILTRVKIENKNSELIPGSFLEIQIKYNERDSLSIPDTGVIYEGDKKFVYKVLENNTVQKIEVTTGSRNKGKIELLSGLVNGNKVVAEGLTKVRPRIKIKPIIKPK
ncbi:MAG: efflux RND transporter periplasmic adaptor subunit [Pelagibacteraceae bacterium]|jgi:membrane fusion protein (multidrug efflux system)|nr:efflux RND transporter periplasmic adaptor subunit [Pelagibacteraceae bacterium]|tara:strand:- start:12282 stop:13157 length:876 start_codon:yes stop_codon:yes gene_type:complete